MMKGSKKNNKHNFSSSSIGNVQTVLEPDNRVFFSCRASDFVSFKLLVPKWEGEDEEDPKAEENDSPNHQAKFQGQRNYAKSCNLQQ